MTFDICEQKYLTSNVTGRHRRPKQMLSLHYASIRSWGILIAYATFLQNFIFRTVAELAHVEKSCNHLITQFI